MKGQSKVVSSIHVSLAGEAQENIAILDENSSVTLKKSPGNRKSLIPLLKEKKSTPTRQALTPLQKSGTPSENVMVGQENVMSGSRKSSIGKLKIIDTPRPPSNKSKPIISKKVRTALIVKGNNVEKNIQTDNPDIDLITGEEPSLTYWKELAETRREALAEALEENETLHQRVEHLEKENKILEQLVDEAKKLAELINSISEEENQDESGIERDSEEIESTGRNLSS